MKVIAKELNGLLIESYLSSLFKSCKDFEKKSRVKGDRILGKNEQYKKNEANKPDFKCKFIDRDIIFEITNLQDLIDGNLKFNPGGELLIYNLTDQASGKIREKIDNNFDHINGDFKNPVVLILNIDQSDIDFTQVAVVVSEELKRIEKSELISAVIATEAYSKKGVLFTNNNSKNELKQEEFEGIRRVFSENNFNFS